MQKSLLIVLFFLLIISFALPGYSQYLLTYKYSIELGKKSLADNFYDEALHYFELASLLNPTSEEALFYIDFIKRLKERRVEVAMILDKDIPDQRLKSKETVVREVLDIFEIITEKRAQKESREQYISRKLEDFELGEQKKGAAVYKRLSEKQQAIDRALGLFGKKIEERKSPLKTKEIIKKAKLIFLTDELWEELPIYFEMETRSSLIIKGQNIKRFLAISPEIIEVERKNKDELRITANVRKSFSFLHVWDDRGRWTFHIRTIYPRSIISEPQKGLAEESVEPFKFIYSADWNSYYTGANMAGLERETLSFIQRLGTEGETPYGKFDGSTTLTKFKESTEVTSYTAGLADGKIGNFKNFNLRVFDLYKSFSRLSLPGTGLRGAYLEGKAFNNLLGYDFVWGRKEITYGFISSGSVEEQDEYIEGARFTLFPHGKNKYSFNFLHGYGSGREEYLSDKVYSLEARHNFGNLRLFSEVGFDEDNIATNINSRWKKGNLSLNLDFRNIEKDYTTITSRAADRGEIGARIALDYVLSDLRLSSDLDVYRDRNLFNTGSPKALNFDWQGSLFKPLNSSSSWRTSLYNTYTPGLTSPRKSFRLNNTYYKSFKFFNDRTISWFAGNSYQRNRLTFSPSSDYNRYGLSAGIRFPIIERLSYYLNYDYSWLEECLSGEEYNPKVLTMGISYDKQLSRALAGSLNVSYRDEEETEGTNSFLAGEDTLQLSLGLTYHPSPDVEFFVNGAVANIWAEGNDRDAYNSADIRWGVRSSWDLLFSWNPQGLIQGTVFNDLNGNSRQDEGEKGIAGIKVKVGRKELVTNSKGEYKQKVRAKSVIAALEVKTVPQGYIFSSSSSKKIDIVHKETYQVDFGLTTQSGIYGVVFYDKNANGKPDIEDVFIPKVKIILDSADITFTGNEGSYFFRKVPSGKHSLRIDMQTIPLEYIPLVKITSEINLSEGTTSIFHIPLKKKP